MTRPAGLANSCARPGSIVREAPGDRGVSDNNRSEKLVFNFGGDNGKDVRLFIQAAADRRLRRGQDLRAVPVLRGRVQHHLHLDHRYVVSAHCRCLSLPLHLPTIFASFISRWLGDRGVSLSLEETCCRARGRMSFDNGQRAHYVPLPFIIT